MIVLLNIHLGLQMPFYIMYLFQLLLYQLDSITLCKETFALFSSSFYVLLIKGTELHPIKCNWLYCTILDLFPDVLDWKFVTENHNSYFHSRYVI